MTFCTHPLTITTVTLDVGKKKPATLKLYGRCGCHMGIPTKQLLKRNQRRAHALLKGWKL